MKQTASTSMQMGQQLNLTPQLLQSIRLLQFDALELEQEIRRVLELNPLLELEEESEPAPATPEADPAAEAAAFDELPEPSMWDSPGGSWQDGMDDGMQRIADQGSSDPMLRILERAALELPADDLEIAAFWLEHCDDAGYLDAPLEALTLRACARFDRPASEVEGVRQRLLAGDPAGVAAQDLRECLLAQLAALPAPAPARPLATRILETELELLAAHDLPAIARRLQREEDDVGEAVRVILSLEPRPAEAAAPQAQTAVIPDVVIWHADGIWRVALNRANSPRVSINPGYERAVSEAGSSAATGPMRELLQEARWFTRGLSMRYDTLLRTARVIVERQSAFLEHGDESLAPLTLKEVADAIGMHESTVSRITTGKYLQTPRGTIEMKRFFGVRLEGASVSGTAVRAMVRRLIDSEPPQRPLADEAIATLLARRGIRIARRTVAKYREQLDIAPARARRRCASASLAPTG